MPSFPVIDADGHVIEPPDLWQQYVEEPYRQRAPKRLKDQYGMTRFLIEDRVVPAPEGYGAGSRHVKTILRHSDSGAPVARAFDPQERLKDMDREGVDTAVLYGTDGLLALAVRDPELATALARGFNTWMAEFCQAAPQRLKGTAILPLQDVPKAVRELQRGVQELGLVAGVIPYHVGGKDLSHLERMDEHYETLPRQEAPLLQRKPSAYVRQGEVYFACAPEEETLAHTAAFVGEDHIIFATDYPHFDAPFPHSVRMVAERQGLSEAAKRKILGENAARLYRLASDG